MATCGTCSKEYKADTRYNRGGNCTNCCRKGICVNCHDPGLIASKGLCDACYKFKRRWGCDRYSTESLQRLPEKQRRLTEIEKLTQERDEAREAIRTMCSGWPALDGDQAWEEADEEGDIIEGLRHALRILRDAAHFEPSPLKGKRAAELSQNEVTP